jgi:hypothetical protein
MQGLSDSRRGKHTGMLRKALWSGLFAGIAAGTGLIGQKLASSLWRLTTGDPPPEKR